MRVIAIDGPAGSGKSTVARVLADRLGLQHLDTGAMYRAVACAVLDRNVALDDDESASEVAAEVGIDIDSAGTVRVDGVDVTAGIRGPEVTAAVSTVAALPGVRAELVSRQRKWVAERGGGVIEGRDIGSVVFPDAELKVFLTASPEVRAARRSGENAGSDPVTTAAALARRDEADSKRAHSPMHRAQDALEIDTSDMTVEQILDLVIGRLQ